MRHLATTAPGFVGVMLSAYRPSSSVAPHAVGPGAPLSLLPMGTNVTSALGRGLPSIDTFPETWATL